MTIGTLVRGAKELSTADFRHYDQPSHAPPYITSSRFIKGFVKTCCAHALFRLSTVRAIKMGSFDGVHLLVYVSIVGAMDMSSTSGSSSSGSMSMMVPYLHFTGGDYLFFDTLAPTSNGAIAGACIALAVLAILERAVAGVRGIFVLHVLHRQRTLLQQGTPEPRKTLDIKKVSTAATSSRASSAPSIQPLPATRQRSTPPFLWSYEFTRGGLFIIQSFFAYAIMLAIMSFNAAYIISIIAGTAIGEVLFGRFISNQSH